MDLAVLEQEAWYLLRILIAVVLGFLIGWERKKRSKEASLRTHAIVSLGSALVMVISKYGFTDLGTSYDGARLAAQIVSGIGFLGAGMIFYHKETIHGLTTAAGIWTTAAIGMAAGAGWYIVSAVATILIILIQCIMHMNFKVFHAHHFVKVNIVFVDKEIHGSI